MSTIVQQSSRFGLGFDYYKHESEAYEVFDNFIPAVH